MMFFTVQAVGWLYLGVAVILGGLFIYRSWRLLLDGSREKARQLYLYSLLYLALLFAGIMIDSVLPY
jgi:protoheme IX farnesyltransferase